MFRIGILAIPEALPYAMMGPLDVLRASTLMAANLKPGTPVEPLSVELVGLSAESYVSINGVTVKPDAALNRETHYDLIWIPSLLMTPQGLFNTHPKVQQWLLNQYREGAEIVSVCTGAFLLAETGLLDGLKATTHWAYSDLFRQKFPRVLLAPELAIAENERIQCAAAGFAWHDMVMGVLERQYGRRCAVETAKLFLLQYHFNGQGHLLTPAVRTHEDALVHRAERWLSSHLSEDNLISRVAGELGIHEATFARRFKAAMGMTPKQWILLQRIEKAKEALELTDKTVEEISAQVGYQDSSFFRRVFKRETGLSPARYRKEYQG